MQQKYGIKEPRLLIIMIMINYDFIVILYNPSMFDRFYISSIPFSFLKSYWYAKTVVI